MKQQIYLVGTNEAQAQRGQHFDDCRAAVALDWEVGLQLWHYTLPAQVLPHQGTKVTHCEGTLLHLETRDHRTVALGTQSNWLKPLNANLTDSL